VTGVYSQQAGSPYLFLKGEAHVLSAGTLVSGEGIPDGAFLKRIFPDGCIELSVPAAETIDGNTVVCGILAGRKAFDQTSATLRRRRGTS
jgi:hypothetical protein